MLDTPMNLRRNKALKCFAILLFSLEMIAPALMSAGNEAIRQSDETQLYSNEGYFANFISSFLYEENAGEEEERESKDHKGPLAIADPDLYNNLFELIAFETRQTFCVDTHHAITTQRPLFTLFHTYLI